MHPQFAKRFKELFGARIFTHFEQNYKTWVGFESVINANVYLPGVTSPKMNTALRCWLRYFNYDYKDDMVTIIQPNGESKRVRGKTIYRIQNNEPYHELVEKYFDGFYNSILSYHKNAKNIPPKILYKKYVEWFCLYEISEIYIIEEQDFLNKALKRWGIW